MKKEITLFYFDSASKSQFDYIADEANKRGYKVKMTDNPFEKCEIGFYCDHLNFPQHSEFSVIMLHDVTQQYNNWPNIWDNEPWDKYDIGILPSKQWVDNWNKCSYLRYANPKIGMFEIGWPKADVIKKYDNVQLIESLYKKYNLDKNKKTILYAPAWENDNKQDDFVKSMQKLNVNILIKQAPWNSPKWLKEKPEIYKNVQEMKEKHKDIENVTILNENLNIFEAIAMSDVLVSEESSTMCEATMLGIPAVSVSNWLIPDVEPHRYPKCDYEFVTTTTKEKLTECITEILDNYQVYKKQTEEYSNKNFSNIGYASSMIMDIIDDVIENKKIRYKKLFSNNKNITSMSHEIKSLKREIYFYYAKKSKLINNFVQLYIRIKKRIKH